MKRPIAALEIPDVVPHRPATPPPVHMLVKPEELLVDETYQRDLSDASVRLIRKIVAEWDWRKFKAPVVAMTEEGPVLLDGQHTATAAASHPGIAEIPVLLVEAAEARDQAQAFVGINTSRLGITAAQLHHANVAAGDALALTIERVCVGAGVKVLRLPPSRAVYKPGETIAVAAIRDLVRRQGEDRSRQVLGILVAAELGPIQAAQIRAVETLVADEEFAELEADDLPRIIGAVGIDTAEKDAKAFAVTHCVPLWRALAAVWFKARKTRGKARSAPPQQGEVSPSDQPLKGEEAGSPAAFDTTPSEGVDFESTPAATPSRDANVARRLAEHVEAARKAVPAPNFSGPGRAGR